MPTPILATKLYIPSVRSRFVFRPRLIAQMNEGLYRKLTLISAPAGFGKTTLVSDWIANHELPVAWLSLDDGDNNFIRFLTYLVAALQTISPAIGESVLTFVQLPQPPPPESLLTALLNDLTTLSKHFVLVLDDYHIIDTKSVDETLIFLLDHLPPQMHLVITTREDPYLPVARLRAQSQLTELRASDLRFTPDETAGFLNQVMGLMLSTEAVAALETRTEGWIAGLQLAAISMQGIKDTTRFIKSFTGSNRFVLDYLAEEVLHRQPESIQTFLLCTSILDRMCGALCDAVLANVAVSGQETLEFIERSNLFIVPLDSERRWYRYHHLFADLLRQRLRQNSAPAATNDAQIGADVAELHERASVWYANNGFRADAIHHALVARDFVQAANLVELAWPEMDGSFQAATWLNWARAIPDEFIRIRPVLSVAYAWALLNGGDLEAAEARLRDAERWLDVSPEQREPSVMRSAPIPTASATTMLVIDDVQFRNLPASIATARAFQTQARGDISGSVKYGLLALALLPESDYLRRGPAAALLGLAHWASGELEAAYQALANAMTDFKKVGNLHFAISGTYGLADIRTTQGHLREAIKIYNDVLQLALAQGEPPLRGTADLYLGLSKLYLEQGNFEAAIQNLQHSEALGEQAALPDWRYRLCRTQARFKETLGDLSGALSLFDEAEKYYFRSPVPDLCPLSVLKARIWVVQGRLNEALRWVSDQGLTVNDELKFLHEAEHITLARVLIAVNGRDPDSHTVDDVLRLLDRLQQAAEDGGRLGSVIEIALLRTLVYHVRGNRTAARLALERALTIAEPEGYVRIFIDEGIPMAQLLSEPDTRRSFPDYTDKLLAAFKAEAQRRSDETALPSAPSAQLLIEPLSQRELEILRLIALGLSNREISEQLFLALDTVKGHNGRIFAKLSVQRRTEAVARARELGLL